MCSIYGIMYYKNSSKEVIKEKIEKMSLKTLHRGPDEKEIRFFGNFAIGMNRLSIVGTEERNAMVQEYDELCSVFNGEITNYKELSKELQESIECDSEVILPMYKKYGAEFIKKLGGMFSISIYDNIKNEIYLWRDALRS